MSLPPETQVVRWWLSDDPTLAAELKPDDLPERVRESGFRHLDFTAEHGTEGARLPSLHRDPFDRMLVAQAKTEHLTLVTRLLEPGRGNSRA